MQSYVVLITLAIFIFGIFGANAGSVKHEEDNAPAYYKFAYGVNDPHTGDKKEHYETRDGHVVKGAYTMQEADGTVRIVEYTAEPHKGFNAVVKRLGVATHPQIYKTYGGHKSGVPAGKPSFGKGYGVKEPEEYAQHEGGATSSINNNLGYSGGKDNGYTPKNGGYNGGKSASYTTPQESHFSEIKEGEFGAEPSEYEAEFEEELAGGYTNKQNTYGGPSSKIIVQNEGTVVPNLSKGNSGLGVARSYVGVHFGPSTPRH